MNLDDKLKMAHEYFMQVHKFVTDNNIQHNYKELIKESWDYVFDMQAEADKRKEKGFPEALKDDWQPDWSVAPKWAKWWAMDSSGDSYFYDFKPYIMFNAKYWADHNNLCLGGRAKQVDGCFNYQGDWKKSLRKRP